MIIQTPKSDLRTLITLTNDMILDDIAGFQNRIQVAREKLDALPAAVINWKDHKKIKTKRRELESDIKHIRGLISIAEEALE